LVDAILVLSRNCGIFLLHSSTVHVYDNDKREIFLMWRFGTAFRQAETTMYKLQTYRAN